MDLSPNKDNPQKIISISSDDILNDNRDEILACPPNLNCNELQYPCISCDLNSSCEYGKEMNTTCHARKEVKCNVSFFFTQLKCF